MQFNLENILSLHEKSGKSYFEFINVPALSMGIYVLQVGDKDLQKPHSEDEVYYVLEGKGMFFQDGEEIAITKGSILFVPAMAEHYFFFIEEKLSIMVFFAPAEYTKGNSHKS